MTDYASDYQARAMPIHNRRASGPEQKKASSE